MIINQDVSVVAQCLQQLGMENEKIELLKKSVKTPFPDLNPYLSLIKKHSSFNSELREQLQLAGLVY